MKKFFSFALTALLTFILVTGAQAKTITIGFDEIDAGETLFNQYGSDGIYFRDTLNLSGNSPATVEAENIINNYLKPNDSSQSVFILFTAPIVSFSCIKWEPGSSGTDTVYFKFYGEGGSVINTIANSDKNDWSAVLFSSGIQIKAIEIVGDVENNAAYFLDDMEFVFASTNNNTTVPEPFTLALLSLGLIGLSGFKKRFYE